MDMNIDIGSIFNIMPEEQQDKFIRNMLRSKESDHIQTVIFGPAGDGDDEDNASRAFKSFSMRDLVSLYGEDEAVGIIKGMLASGAVNARYVDREAMEQMRVKLANGTASPEEEAAMKYILEHQASNEINREQFIGITLRFLLDLIQYMQEKYDITPYYTDIMSAVYISILGSMMHTEDTPMARFVNTTSEQNSRISKTIADDIEKALSTTLFKDKKPNNQFLVLGFLELAERYATKDEDLHKMVYSCASELISYFGLEDKDDSDSEDNKKK